MKKPKDLSVCAGGGVHLSDAVEELRDFAHDTKIPVVSTMMGLGVMKTQDPMYLGMVGNNGKAYANRAMNQSDASHYGRCTGCGQGNQSARWITENKILVHIDVDPAEMGKNVGPTIPLVGDVKHIFNDFAKPGVYLYS